MSIITHLSLKTLCLAAALMFVFGRAPAALAQNERSPGRTDSLETITGWSYRWGDSPLDAQGVPQWTQDPDDAGWQTAPTLLTPPGEPQEYLWLRTRLPEVLPDHPALGTRYIWLSFEAYLGTEKIGQYGVMGPYPGNKYNGQKLHVLPLPADAGGRMLYVRAYSPYPAIIGIPHQVFLSSEYGLMSFALRYDLSSLIVGLILSVAGLLLLILKAHGQSKDPVLFYLGLFSFCYGINYAFSHPAVDLVLQAPRLIYYGVALFPLFPVGLLGFFERMIDAGYKSIIRILRYGHLLLWIVVMLLDVLNVAPYYLTGTVFFSLLAVSLIAMIVTVIPAMREGRTEAKIFGVGMLLAVIPGLSDTIIQGILVQYDMPALSPWGVAAFMVVMSFLLDRYLSENTRQLRAAHTQLEAYSATLEQRVEQRTNELSAKNEALTSTLNELQTAQRQLIQQEKMASLGQLTAGIAHEIKNPLNFVNNFAELNEDFSDEILEEIEANPELRAVDLREMIADLKQNSIRIAKHGKHADQIVRSMMQHAGRESERYEVAINPLVSELISITYRSLQSQKPDLEVSIERDLEESTGSLIIAPQEIGRVLQNILGNAFEAVYYQKQSVNGAYEPKVSVATRRQNGNVEIRISDNGPGIPDRIRERIFEPFFTTKPAGSGTGLGLSLSYDIVVQGYGGKLEVSSQEGEGATFVVMLPDVP